MILDHIFTGHRSLSEDLYCVMVSPLLSFFCRIKVIDTQSALYRRGSAWEISFLPLKNCTFFKVNNFVLLGPDTWMYSQDLIAKKKAPMNNSHNALSKGDNAIE